MTGTSQDHALPSPTPEPGPEAAATAPAAASGPRAPRRPWWRFLRFGGGLLVRVLLLVVLLLGLVLGTQTGLETALGIVDALAPGLIAVDRVEGRLLGRLHLEGLTVHLSGLDLRLGRLDLDWAPLAAVTGTLTISRLVVQDLDLTSTPSATPEASAPLILPDLDLPITVVVDEARVEHLRVLEPGAAEPVFVLDRAALAGRLAGSALDLRALEADLAAYGLKARAAGHAELAGRYPLGLNLDWDLTRPPAVAVAGRGRIGGDLDRLTLEVDLTGSAEASLRARLADPLGHPAWEGLIEITGVRAPDFQAGAPPVALRGRLETKGDLAAATLSGTLDGSATDSPDLGHLHADLDARWADQRLELRTLDFTESVSGARLAAQGELDLKADPGRFRLTGTWEKLRWPLTGTVAAAAPRGWIEASGTFDAYDYALAAAVEGPAFPAVDLDLKGRGDARGTRIGALVVRTLGGSLEAGGDLSWAPDLAWDLKVEARDLNPAGVVPGLEDRVRLSFATKGGLKGFSYDLSAGTQGPGLPPARLLLGGTGDLQGTLIETLSLEVLKGRITGRARAAWDPAVTWEADLTATGLDPGGLAPDWPGRIDGRLTTTGRLDPRGDPKGLDLSVVLAGVQGTLRGYPIAVAGAVRMAGGTLRIEGLNASSGPSTARVEGSVGLTPPEALDVRFDLDSPDLASLLPDARGSVRARGRVQGPPKTPALALELDIRDAAVAGQGIARLAGSADLSLAPDGPLRMQFDGQGLALGGLRWETLRLRADGRLPSHRLSLTATGAPLSLDLEAAGGLRLPTGGPLQYQGSLARLDLKTQDFGDWRLQRPVPLRLDGASTGTRIGAGPLCLRNAQGSGGCVEFAQTAPGQWTLEFDLSPLGTDLLAGRLPPNLMVEGSARVRGRFAARGPVLTGSAVAEVPRGLVTIAPAGALPEVLDLSGTRLTLDAGEPGLGARFNLPVKDLGSLGATLDLPGWRLDAPARPAQPLRGTVRGNFTGLARLGNLTPDITGVTGRLNLDLALSGTLGKPDLRGQAALRGFGAEAPLTGTRVSGFDLVATAAQDRVTIEGQGAVGGRPMQVRGSLRTGPGGPAGRLTVTGERLKVADTREYLVVVTPNLEVALAPTGAQVRGAIAIPEARIRPRKLPAGVVLPSPDVIVVGAGGTRKPPFPIDIDLALRLGNNVTIDAFGVRGRLTGELRLRQVPGGQLLADGQLGIVDGTYRYSAGFALPTEKIPFLGALGADLGAPLTIVQGFLLYVQTPIDHPGLLLIAERDNGSMSAGIRVVGTLRNPKLAFFSESDPGMTQAQIAKYLLTGMAPSGDGEQGTTLSVGTYVAPKLFVEYTSGIGNAQNGVEIRYDLTRSIQIQAESGAEPGFDVFYQFEH